MEVITFYIRLLSYSEACELVNWFNSSYEKIEGKYTKSFANITVGGTTLQGTQKQIEKAVIFLEDKGWRYELTLEHPSEVNKAILNNLKLKYETNKERN